MLVQDKTRSQRQLTLPSRSVLGISGGPGGRESSCKRLWENHRFVRLQVNVTGTQRERSCIAKAKLRSSKRQDQRSLVNIRSSIHQPEAYLRVVLESRSASHLVQLYLLLCNFTIMHNPTLLNRDNEGHFMRFGRELIVRNKPSLSTPEVANLPATYLNITILGLHQACSAGPGRSGSNPFVAKVSMKAMAQTYITKRTKEAS